LPSSASNCLARRCRLNGQKRVPRPPARITGWKFVLDTAYEFAISDSRLQVENPLLNLPSKIGNLQFLYILVSGSGTGVPGTDALRNSTDHCGRT
jgi:hypothetical protein